MSKISTHSYFIGLVAIGLAGCLTKSAIIRHHKRHVPILSELPPHPNFQPQLGQHPNFQPKPAQHPNFQPQSAQLPNFQPQTGQHPNFQPQPAQLPNFQPQPAQHSNFQPEQQQQPEQIRRNSVYDIPDAQNGGKSNVFFGEEFARSGNQGATFENVPSQFIGPNYAFSSGNNGMPMTDNERISADSGYPPMMNPFLMGMSANAAQQQQQGSQQQPTKSEDSINDMFTATLKKYNVKKYLLDKILGSSHEADEDEGGFFSNKHLKRHGNAGLAGKVIGELIGIKIRETIEGFGKSFSEYAKDFTSRNFVNIGQAFSRMIKF